MEWKDISWPHIWLAVLLEKTRQDMISWHQGEKGGPVRVELAQASKKAEMKEQERIRAEEEKREQEKKERAINTS